MRPAGANDFETLVDEVLIILPTAPLHESLCLSVIIVNDNVTEQDEAFYVSVSVTSPDMILGSAISTITIVDDGDGK